MKAWEQGVPPKTCRVCGRTFSTVKKELANEKQFCHRSTMTGGYCDDKRCMQIRRINKRSVQILWKGVKTHCTENVIKAVEKGWRDK
jgi:hypothetical protein